MKDIYEVLKHHGIPYEKYEHPAVFTTQEADVVCTNIPGKQAKNLFLTNGKGDRHFLITIAHDKRADLKHLSQRFGQKGLRFASPERLQKYLGLTPGSVSPLGLINDMNKEVAFFIDAELLEHDMLYVHPNINTATVGIKVSDFKKLLESLGREITSVVI